MKAVRNGIDLVYGIVLGNKRLARLKPVVDAMDAFFFSSEHTTSGAPHILDCIEIKRYMSAVILALAPAVLASIYFFGLRIILMIAVSYIFGGLVEVLFAVVRKREIEEGFLVTGMIFPMILPPTTPLWVVAVGIVAGVLFGKEVFGGTGRNIFNPALVGRVFVTIAFPVIMTSAWVTPVQKYPAGFVLYESDAVTTATPLMDYKNKQELKPYEALLTSKTAGSAGETFRLGIILGGIFLLLTRVSNWRIPVSYLISTFIFSFIANRFISARFAPPVFQLLSGGLLFGAFFMATDPVTSPFTRGGKWIAGLLLGVLTVLIRALSGYVEGVMFAILLMNTFTPLIDSLIINFRYRESKVK